jgi:hypothetical protein
LQGNAKTSGTEHHTAHQADQQVEDLGNLKTNGPVGTAPLGEIARIYEHHAIAARPECASQIKAAVAEAMKDVDPNQSGRTTDSKPTGNAKDHLDAGGSAKPDVKLPKPTGKK